MKKVIKIPKLGKELYIFKKNIKCWLNNIYFKELFADFILLHKNSLLCKKTLGRDYLT